MAGTVAMTAGLFLPVVMILLHPAFKNFNFIPLFPLYFVLFLYDISRA
ncbi:MAG: hypothetical protein FWC84_01770 [Alphaproteobacteria bacterium]|nr:hypothetical protein [Alphaproteobacteria bacterium]